MVSKKKAKGKARKAAQDAKAEEENALEAPSADVGDNFYQPATIDDLLREKVEAQSQPQSLSASLRQCGHGFDFGERPEETEHILDFIKAFMNGYVVAKKECVGEENDIVSTDMIVSCFNRGIDATAESYADIYDAAMLRKVASCCVAIGTGNYLFNELIASCAYAYLAFLFDQYIEVHLKKSQPREKWQQILELHHADTHTLVSFLRRHIPCKCLDKEYKEVKSVIKIGICANPSCSLPDRQAPRTSMFSCADCYSLCYCSIECQKAHWPEHKVECAEIANLAANFDATHHGVVCGYVNQSGKLCIFGYKY